GLPSNYAPPNRCKKLTKRRMLARAASAALEQSTLDGGTRLARPVYYAARAACRGPRRCVKPFCNLCDSRWADSSNTQPEPLHSRFVGCVVACYADRETYRKPAVVLIDRAE